MPYKNGYRADYLIVGAGFAGATFARMAAEAGHSSLIIDQRPHIGGNAHTYTDAESGVEVHQYGPHIFHTNDEGIWQFVRRFADFNSYVNRVKATSGGRVFGLPINLLTINQFFGEAFSPAQAAAFIEQQRRRDIERPNNFEEHVLSQLGPALYEAFFKHYTTKHWGKSPRDIPVSTAKRLPIRFNYDDNYFNDRFQGIPTEGYTKLFERLLAHPLIRVGLGESFEGFRQQWRQQFRYLIYTGSIDAYFAYQHGELPYRTVRFEAIRDSGDIVGNAVMNFTDDSVPHTRIHEHKWFAPERKTHASIAFIETPGPTTSRHEPYYPVRDAASEACFAQYRALADAEKDVIFVGRLAEFRYYDMHQVIGSAMSAFRRHAASRH